MATSQSSQTDEPPHQAYKDLRGNHMPVHLSPNTQRIFWPFDGVFPTSISIMNTPNSTDSLEPYFQQDAGGSSSGTWHVVSQSPLTEPKVSSITVSVYDLDHWEQDWLERHREHVEPSRQYETLDDGDARMRMTEDGWEMDSDQEYLLICCNQERPTGKAVKLVVKPSAGNEFVTIHDYLSSKSGL
jgi:hypothetical protein